MGLLLRWGNTIFHPQNNPLVSELACLSLHDNISLTVTNIFQGSAQLAFVALQTNTSFHQHITPLVYKYPVIDIVSGY